MLISYDKIVAEHNVDVRGIVHVGAHLAEEMKAYTRNNVKNVIWIEANPYLFSQLSNRILHMPGHHCYNFAAYHIGGEQVSLNIASNGESSSILEFGSHASKYPSIKYTGKVQVYTKRLDDFLIKSQHSLENYNFLNLDVQGVELLVLRGASKILDKIDYIYAEVNEEHLYKDCCLVGEVDEYLGAYGFTRKATRMLDAGWGDALYIKRP